MAPLHRLQGPTIYQRRAHDKGLGSLAIHSNQGSTLRIAPGQDSE